MRIEPLLHYCSGSCMIVTQYFYVYSGMWTSNYFVWIFEDESKDWDHCTLTAVHMLSDGPGQTLIPCVDED